MNETANVMDEDWNLILSLLPSNWEQLGRTSGALRGLRQDKSAQACLRTLLLHVGCGFSLRETALRARESGMAKLSSVALFKRLRKAGPWLQQLCLGLLGERLSAPPAGGPSLRLIDGTLIKEPGPTGSQWRVHYSFQWPRMECDSFHLTPTTGKDTGESLRHFAFTRGDHGVADRGFCRARDFHHAAACGAFVAIRLNPDGIRLETPGGELFVVQDQLKEMTSPGQVAEWEVMIPLEGQPSLPARLCVVVKSQAARAEAGRKLRRRANKRGNHLQPETLLYAGHVMVLTTFSREQYSTEAVLETYRFRWQIELLFKRLKSLAGLGHLPKHDAASAQAWLYGKLLLALLTEKLLSLAESFSPWGYRLHAFAPAQPLA